VPKEVSHFEELARLLELERAEQRRRYAEEASGLSAAEREAKGRLVSDLELGDETIGLGGRMLATLSRAGGRKLLAPLYPGDCVALSPKRDASLRAHAVVVRAAASSVQVAFEHSPPSFLEESGLRLEVLPNEATFDRARAALREVQQTKRGRLREVLLGQRRPALDAPAPFTEERPLNPEQQEAVGRCLSAEDFFLVHGPPGTGKSTVLAEVAVQSAMKGQKILATAASNAAVDHLLDISLARGLSAVRIGHPARVAERFLEHTLDIMVESHPDREVARGLFDEAFGLLGYARKQRKQGRSRERFANARSASSDAKKLLDEARALERKAVAHVIENAQVVCVTLASLDVSALAGATFDLALVDEATQAIEPLSLLAFLKSTRVVMAGDPFQLPPTVLSQQASERGLSVSLFERLLAEHGPSVSLMLAEQYRMHEDIMSFPSTQMYGGKLRAHDSVKGHRLRDILPAPSSELDAPPVLWLDTAGKGFEEEAEAGTDSLYNPGEAELVAARARELLERGLAPRDLAVVAPYRAQASLLREKIDAPEVEVDTVDAFQGREKEAILVSLTRGNSEGKLGFLTDLRRMNVAMTRARRHLFLVGDSSTLSSHPFYAQLFDWVQSKGFYRSAWEWPAPTVV
jgi:superfamily I DNA and/or RNA helicase